MKPATISVLALAALTGCATGPSLPSYGVVPDFRLTDQSGSVFESKQRLDGKVWVANFIFTNCSGPCPRMSSQFRKLSSEVPATPDFRLVSFTIDPARDTPVALATYGRRFGTFHLARIDGSLEHGTRFVLVDRKSRIRGYYDSADEENMRKLVTDIGSLLR